MIRSGVRCTPHFCMTNFCSIGAEVKEWNGSAENVLFHVISAQGCRSELGFFLPKFGGLFSQITTKSDLKLQAACVIILTEGVPTNGYLPLVTKKLLRSSWGRVGRSNFFLLCDEKKLPSLASFCNKDK